MKRFKRGWWKFVFCVIYPVAIVETVIRELMRGSRNDLLASEIKRMHRDWCDLWDECFYEPKLKKDEKRNWK